MKIPNDTSEASPESKKAAEAARAKLADEMRNAKPPERKSLPTLEGTNPELAAALKRLASAPGVDSQLAVAEAYRRAGVLDESADHFDAALRLKRSSAAAHDGLARLLRDGGRLDRALSEAHRAVFYAPQSAAAWNTLGTILQDLRLFHEARTAYAKAAALDSTASYAQINECEAALLAGNTDATAACSAALRLDAAGPAETARLREIRATLDGEQK